MKNFVDVTGENRVGLQKKRKKKEEEKKPNRDQKLRTRQSKSKPSTTATNG
jgi:hypothetical protein